jgi:hypothetical protein
MPATLTMQEFLDTIHDGKMFSLTCYKRGTSEERTYVGRVDVAKFVKGIGLNYDPLGKNLLVIYETDKHQYRQANLDSPVSLKLHGEDYIWDQEEAIWRQI